MNSWTAVLWAVLIGAALPTLYGLHRLCLWLEARGLLYYRHKKPGGSPAGCMTALREVIEPPVRHVLHIKEEKRRHTASEGDPPSPGGGGEEAASDAPAPRSRSTCSRS